MGRTRTATARLRDAVTADALLVVALVGLTDLLFVSGYDGSALAFVPAALFVLFLPGYALVSALFPADGSSEEGDSLTALSGVDGPERLVLSVGLSVVVAPLLGLAVNYTTVGLDPAAVVATLSAFTLGATVVGAWRRARLPASRRFTLPLGRWAASARVAVRSDSGPSRVVVAVVVLSLLVAAGGVTWAALARPPGEAFTEFYLLSTNESAAPVADDYPTEFVVDESRPVTVGVTNRERTPAEYTVVVRLQRVERENGSATVARSRELSRFGTPTLAHGEAWTNTVAVTPRTAGEDLRVVFDLYRGDARATADPYRRTQLWIDVDRSGEPG